MPIATNSSKIDFSNEKNLSKFSLKIANIIKSGDTILLYGDLGIGKTTFVKKLINNIQKKKKTKKTEVLSPTFNIVQEYKVKNLNIQHYDLFRIEKKNDLKNIGLFEDKRCLTLIEWADKLKTKPMDRIELKFRYSKNYTKRYLRVNFFGRLKK